MSSKTKTKRKEIDVTNQFIGPRFEIKDIKFTPKQRELIRLVRDENTKVVFVEGPAGSAKSFVSVFCALLSIKEGSKERVKYIRSLVESSQSKIGFLKGSLEEKTSPYGGPLLDKLDEYLTRYDYERLIHDGVITSMCPNFLRGSTFKNEFVIVDESQNCSMADLITIISRIGDNSTLIFCSDKKQSDIKNSGIERFTRIFDSEDCKEAGIHIFKFTAEDIMRSEILKFIMGKIEKEV